jgi:hypothetical protein
MGEGKGEGEKFYASRCINVGTPHPQPLSLKGRGEKLLCTPDSKLELSPTRNRREGKLLVESVHPELVEGFIK